MCDTWCQPSGGYWISKEDSDHPDAMEECVLNKENCNFWRENELTAGHCDTWCQQNNGYFSQYLDDYGRDSEACRWDNIQ